MNHFLNFKKLFHVDSSNYQDEIKSPDLDRNTEIVVSYQDEFLGIISFRLFCKVADEYYNIIDSKHSVVMKILSIVWLWNSVDTLISIKLFRKISKTGLTEGELFFYFLVNKKVFSEVDVNYV